MDTYVCEWTAALVPSIMYLLPMYRVPLPPRDLDAIAGDGPSTGVHWSETATQGSSQQSQRGTKETTPGGDGEE